MTPTNKLLAFLRANDVEVLDRRPDSPDPLPFRGDVKAGEFGGYIEHDFKKECLGLCVHHDGCSQTEGGRAEQHAHFHLDRWRSAGGLAYTAVISPGGRFTLAWSLDRRLYSQGWKDISDKPETLGDENRQFKGILVEGNMTGPDNPEGTDEPTPAQLHVLELVRAAFWILFDMKEVTGHFKHGKPACPGTSLQLWVNVHGLSRVETQLKIMDGLNLDSDRGIQEALQLAGFYAGKIDGIFGPKSKRALEAFQKAHDLVPDGVLGPKTRAAFVKAFENGD
jgi:hypothetical protein